MTHWSCFGPLSCSLIKHKKGEYLVKYLLLLNIITSCRFSSFIIDSVTLWKDHSKNSSQKYLTDLSWNLSLRIFKWIFYSRADFELESNFTCLAVHFLIFAFYSLSFCRAFLYFLTNSLEKNTVCRLIFSDDKSDFMATLLDTPWLNRYGPFCLQSSFILFFSLFNLTTIKKVQHKTKQHHKAAGWF